jgi:hypothetical protein
MTIGGWKPRSVFEGYAIVNRTDITDAMKKLQLSEKDLEQAVIFGHEIVTIGSARPGSISPNGLLPYHLNGNAPE